LQFERLEPRGTECGRGTSRSLSLRHRKHDRRRRGAHRRRWRRDP